MILLISHASVDPSAASQELIRRTYALVLSSFENDDFDVAAIRNIPYQAVSSGQLATRI
jgi:hypothetical protein